MMNEHVTSQILLWIAFIIVDAFRNYLTIERSAQRPDYLFSFIIRGMAAIIHGILFDVQDMSDYLPIFVFQVTSFLTVFNPVLNKTRDLGFWYLGKNSGWIDRWLYNKRGLYYVIYFGCVVLFVLSVVVLYIKY